MRKKGNADDFKIWFWLRKARFLNLKGINVTRVFDILVNDFQVGLLRNSVSDDSNAEGVGSNIVN